MRRARGIRRLEMGEAISFEDVLTVITVLLLLRVLFMVPLVNLDKAKTVRAHSDAYWTGEMNWVLSRPPDSIDTKPYVTAFELSGAHAVLTQRGIYRIIEAVTRDSSLLIIRQNASDSQYVSMRVQGPGHAKSFRRGRLLWSATENEWFTASDTLDYGNHPLSKALEKGQRDYTERERGY